MLQRITDLWPNLLRQVRGGPVDEEVQALLEENQIWDEEAEDLSINEA